MSEKKIFGLGKTDRGKLKKMNWKTLLRYPVHLWKDKVSTLEEATERKNETKSFMIANVLIVAACLLFAGIWGVTLSEIVPDAVQSVVTGLTTFIMCIAFVGVLYGVWLWMVIGEIERKMLILQCPVCKTRIAYDEHVQFEVLKSYEIRKKSQNNNGIRVEQTWYAEVGISCKCQQCGAEKNFAEKFTKEKWVDGYCTYSKEIPELVEGFFGDKVSVN